MNLEQIVRETVAKVVAEKKGKDLTGDGKIDSADYLQARDIAIKKAKGLDEDYEVAMAQDSLDSIIRAAMMLKTQIGDQEVNLPAWIQDHITNSENYIYQAAKGYHESSAQTDDEVGEYEETNEANLDHNETSSIEQEGRFWIVTYQTADGTKEKSFESEDEARSFYNTLDEAQDISDDELAQLQAIADDTSKMPAERDTARNKIYTSRTKKESQELDEATIRRWQHYAGIK